MIECLKQIIREYQSLDPLDGLLPRRVAIGSLPGKGSVVTGVRGSGKTTLLRQRIEAHQANWNAILASIIGHHNISHPRAVIDLAQWLVDNSGSFYAVSHLTDYLNPSATGYGKARWSIGSSRSRMPGCCSA